MNRNRLTTIYLTKDDTQNEGTTLIGMSNRHVTKNEHNHNDEDEHNDDDHNKLDNSYETSKDKMDTINRNLFNKSNTVNKIIYIVIGLLIILILSIILFWLTVFTCIYCIEFYRFFNNQLLTLQGNNYTSNVTKLLDNINPNKS